ncbi:ArsR/SmtB family transcription factor [Agarivorans sp. MS3-6]|uniref:ArsR/SmtB family transcription factor n=1 Tax=Agarivorans sp. TSD2052 TaxID=2937286 RepID=UPI00200EB51F|nr:metalloregulator ArsR/SmtB family transcription factor [Agarivorans sp. TSD2052]UPW18343.1 metalloregulator ArsR/SmtB family transcription factor [Agarivorans sp. TSD2052]
MQDVLVMRENAELVSELLKTIAHPDRLVVLCLLSDSEMGVTELRQFSQNSQSAFSQHLKVLRESGLVEVRKEAQNVYYCLADPRIKQLLNSLQQQFCR